MLPVDPKEFEMVVLEEPTADLLAPEDEAAGSSPQLPYPPGRHSFWSGTWNFLNSIVGAGIFGLAYALESAGLWLGLVLLIGIGVLTQFSVVLLVKTGVQVNHFHFETVCGHLFGSGGFYLAVFCMWSFAVGGMLAYLVIIGDTVPVVLFRLTGVPALGHRSMMVLLSAVLVCLPLSSLRDIGLLGRSSCVSIMAVVIIVLLVGLRATPTAAAQQVWALPEQEAVFAVAHPRFAPAFGTIAFAYVCQHSTFLVRNSLAQPAQWPRVSWLAIGAATVLSLALSLTGYLNFERCTRSNILNNLEAADPVANVARLLLAFTMFLTYPMEFFVARQAAQALIRRCRPATSHGPHPAHWLITGLQFVGTLLAGLFLPQAALGPILEFSGGFSAVMLGFVLPGSCYLKLRRNMKVPLHSQPWELAGAVLLLVVGIVAAILSTYSNVRSLIEEPVKYQPWCPLTGVET